MLLLLALLALLALLQCASCEPLIPLTLRTRLDQGGTVFLRDVALHPSKMAIVMVDTWDSHWCMTSSQRAKSFAPYFNHVLKTLRDMGVVVIWLPGEVADTFVGKRARERVMTIQHSFVVSKLQDDAEDGAIEEICSIGDPSCRELIAEHKGITVNCSSGVNSCSCGPVARSCLFNLGMKGMMSELVVDEDRDYVVADTMEIYAVARHLKLELLLYGGFHANECILNKPGASLSMKANGFEIAIVRDMTDVMCGRGSVYDSPENDLRVVLENIEKLNIPTVSMSDTLTVLDAWTDEPLFKIVRISPWGTSTRPFFFDDVVVVTLSLGQSRHCGGELSRLCEIVYTSDGSDPKTSSSVRKYTRPLEITEDTVVRAFAVNKITMIVVSVESSSAFMRLGKQPETPDVLATTLTPLRVVNFGVTDESAIAEAYESCTADSRMHKIQNSICVHAPSSIILPLKPSYQRFVSIAFVREDLLWLDNGFQIAAIPSVKFQVLIDGVLQAESAVMRLSAEAWRFNIAIPRESKIITLAVSDAGDGNRFDQAVWGTPGFLLE